MKYFSEVKMRFCNGFFCCAVLVSVFSINHLGAQDLSSDINTDEVLEEITRLAECTGSYQADFTVVTEKNGISKTAIGHMKYKWPNKSLREIRRQGDGMLMGMVISDGKIKWNYIPIGKVALKYDLRALDEDAQQKGWRSAADLDEQSLKYVGKEQIEEGEVYVLEGTSSDLLKQNNPDRPEKVRVFIGVKDGIIRKLITFNDQGREIASQIYRNVRQDQSIADKDFEFMPPEGTTVHEMKEMKPQAIPPK